MKENYSLFFAECRRAIKLLKFYPLDTINNLVSFVIISTIFITGINALGDSSQIFGVVFFPIMLNLISGPSSSIRSDIEMGVFEQVYIFRYSLLKIAIIRSVVTGMFSITGSVLITLIIHLFFVKIQFSIFHMIILLLLFGIQSLVIGIILAGITLRFRKTETLINSLNLLVMVLMVLPLLTISEKSMYLPSAICPLWGIVTYYQQLMERVDMVSVLKNLGFTVAHTIVFAVIANVIYQKLLLTAKMKGYLGQY